VRRFQPPHIGRKGSAVSKRRNYPFALPLALAAVGIAAVGLPAQSVGRERDVSASTAAAALAPDPLAFATALASERVPAGIVLIRNVVSRSSATGDPQEGARVLLRDAVAQFLTAHPDYSGRTSDESIVLRPKGTTTCDAVLQSPAVSAARAGPAYEVFWRLARAVNPTRVLAIPPGVVCGGPCGNRPTYGMDAHVTLPERDGTLAESLSTVAAQAGLVWVLNEAIVPADSSRSADSYRVCRFSYLDGDYFVQASYELASSR
jgi:hypothetical protein